MKAVIPGIEDSDSFRILDLFKSLSQESKIILFGSRAKGNYREGSDIDICVKQSNLNIEDLFFLSEKYESFNLPWKIDIVIYEKIQEPALKDHIDRVGKLL
jgi:predicted nucleotidyltransferase